MKAILHELPFYSRGTDSSNSCCHRRPSCIETVWMGRTEQEFHCGGRDIFQENLPLSSQSLQQEGKRSWRTPERSRLCLQRAECRVGMAAVGLKTSPFIALHILQYSFEFSHLSLKNKFPEECFLSSEGNSKEFRRNYIQHPENI